MTFSSRSEFIPSSHAGASAGRTTSNRRSGLPERGRSGRDLRARNSWQPASCPGQPLQPRSGAQGHAYTRDPDSAWVVQQGRPPFDLLTLPLPRCLVGLVRTGGHRGSGPMLAARNQKSVAREPSSTPYPRRWSIAASLPIMSPPRSRTKARQGRAACCPWLMRHRSCVSADGGVAFSPGAITTTDVRGTVHVHHGDCVDRCHCCADPVRISSALAVQRTHPQ